MEALRSAERNVESGIDQAGLAGSSAPRNCRRLVQVEPWVSSPSSTDTDTILSFASPVPPSFVVIFKYCIGAKPAIFALTAVNLSLFSSGANSSLCLCLASLLYALARSTSIVSMPVLKFVNDEMASPQATKTNNPPKRTIRGALGDSCGILSPVVSDHRLAPSTKPTMYRNAGPPIQLYRLLHQVSCMEASEEAKVRIRRRVRAAEGMIGPRARDRRGGTESRKPIKERKVEGEATSLSNQAQWWSNPTRHVPQSPQ